MARFKTATDIINQVLVEVGLDAVSDPYSSTDRNVIKLRTLLNLAGEELVSLHPWEILVAEHSITTDSTTYPDGDYPLPSDFAYMMDQTGWNRTENLPLAGPLSGQDWAYVVGRSLVTSTIYASFRQWQGKFYLFPTPPPDSQNVVFEYISRNWVATSAAAYTPAADEVTTGTNVPLFEPIIISRYLKLKFRESTGDDTQAAQADFDQVFSFWTGKDKGGKVITVSRGGSNFPYLDTYRNTPDTNFGS